jgi:hypothetical protein
MPSIAIKAITADANEWLVASEKPNLPPGQDLDPGIAPFKSGQIDRQSKKRIPVIQFLLDTHNGLILNRSMRGVPEQAVAPLTS